MMSSFNLGIMSLSARHQIGMMAVNGLVLFRRESKVSEYLYSHARTVSNAVGSSCNRSTRFWFDPFQPDMRQEVKNADCEVTKFLCR